MPNLASKTHHENYLVFNAVTKHTEIDIYFVRDKVVRKHLQVHFISTKDHIADIRTKDLPSTHFVFLCDR